MQENRLETICARLCLLSPCGCPPSDAALLTRGMMRKLLDHEALDGLVLRERKGISQNLNERARRLLSRALAVYEQLECELDRGYSVLLPDEKQWPERLFKLKKQMPLYLFARGNLDLLHTRTMAVAGSRAITKKTMETAECVGAVLARQGITVVSGCAKGVDSHVQRAALMAGGNVIIVPAIPVKEILRDPLYAQALENGKLLILCETLPDESFSAEKALTRNHTIYALGSCALVMASREGRGGSWAGAKACLGGSWSPVYVLDGDGEDYKGNAALLKLGAQRMMLIRDEQGDELLFEGFGEDLLERYGIAIPAVGEENHAHTGTN